MSEAPRPPAARSPTLEDVAKVAGVSRATVSRVINTTRNVDPTISEAVRKAVEVTGYVPNSAARSLVTRRTGTVALVLSGSDGARDFSGSELFVDPFFGRIVSGLVGFLRPRGLHPVLMVADTARARTQVVDHLRQGNADGAVVISPFPADPLPKLLVDAGLPAVLFARPPRGLAISYVDLANADGAALAADHLVERGRRRIVTIAGPLDVPAGEDRARGFGEAMARHGFRSAPRAVGDFSQDSGERAMERLLAENPDLDGVFAANDQMAHGALHVLREHGRRVPDDVAVVGFDDSSAATASRPALTTVRQPVEDMAAELARLLLERLDQRDRRVTSVLFEPTLVIRQSS